MSRTPNDDRSDSMNPNNDAYYSSRSIDRDDDDCASPLDLVDCGNSYRRRCGSIR